MTRILYVIIAIASAVVSYHINHSVFWAICAWLFWPIAWLKWAICQQISVSVLKASFAFFFA